VKLTHIQYSSMLITLEDPKAPRLFLKVTRWQRVSEIKAMLVARLKVPLSQITLLHDNTILLDEQRIDRRIRLSATLKCLIGNNRDKSETRLSTMPEELEDFMGEISEISYLSDEGNGPAGEMAGEDHFGSLLRGGQAEEKKADTSNIKPSDLPLEPNQQRLYPGLTLTGTCSNTVCTAHNAAMHLSKGFGVFRLRSLTLLCSQCHQAVAATEEVLFYKAKWRFTGVSSEGVRLTQEGWTEGLSHSVVDSSKFEDWSALKLMVHSLFLA